MHVSSVTLIEVNYMKKPIQSTVRDGLSLELKCIVYHHESYMINDLNIHLVLGLLVVVATATIATSIIVSLSTNLYV